MRLLKQSQTAQPLLFLLVQSADHITGLTGASPTVTLSKNGAAFGSPAGAVTELANGWYKVAGNATDTGTLGPLVLHATAASADPVDVEYDVVAFDPQDAVRIGLTALPNAAAGANGGLPTGDASGRVDIGKLLGTAWLTPAVAGTPDVNAKQLGGTAQTARDVGASVLLSSLETPVLHSGTAQAGALGSITLASGASSVDSFYLDCPVKIYAGTGAGQVRIIAAYTGSTRVATPSRSWTTAPDNTSQYAVLSLDLPWPNSAGAVGASGVSGNVGGDVAGKVLGGGSGTITGTGARAVDGSGNAIAPASATTALQADTDDIQARLPAALVGGRIDASVGSYPGNTAQTGDVYPLVDTEVAAIKAKTDNLPATPAAVGSAMTLAAGAITAAVVATDAIDADALAADAVAEIQSGLATSANQTTILNRLGAWTGSGLNTILGAFRALAAKAAALTPTDLSGSTTFDNTTDSLEALKDAGVPTTTSIPTAAQIDTQLSGTHGSGAWGAGSGGVTVYGEDGALEFVWTEFDTDGTTPLAGVEVWVSADAAGTQRSASKSTDATGEVLFNLDAGTAYFWRRRADRTFSNPVTVEVSA